MPRSVPQSSREKVAAYRARRRAEGLRSITIWLPDTRTAPFKAEARRQARLIARSRHEAADQAFVEAISEPLPE